MAATSEEENRVYFKCVKVGSRLRVRVISSGYNHEANCQFPRAVRRDGGIYSAPVSALRFSQGPNHKFFYRVSAKYVRVEEEGADTASGIDLSTLKIYEDESMECIICMDADKSVVFVPCGHYCCCGDCYQSLPKNICPLCRAPIQQAVKRDQIQS